MLRANITFYSIEGMLEVASVMSGQNRKRHYHTIEPPPPAHDKAESMSMQSEGLAWVRVLIKKC
jgi:hypothetical protein